MCSGFVLRIEIEHFGLQRDALVLHNLSGGLCDCYRFSVVLRGYKVHRACEGGVVHQLCAGFWRVAGFLDSQRADHGVIGYRRGFGYFRGVSDKQGSGSEGGINEH